MDQAKILTDGLFTFQEAAYYSRLHPNTLRRWIDMCEVQTVYNEKYISFLDFIQVLAIRDIRRQHKISLKNIRQAVENIITRYGLDYPFARKHTTYIYGKEILIDIPELGLIHAHGKHDDQLTLKKIIEVYIEDITFSDEGLAIRYNPYEGISMDPEFSFGEPVIDSSKIPVSSIWEAVQSEESFEGAALVYGITTEEVKQAVKYINTLDLRAA